MKLRNLHEANFQPQPDPKVAKKASITPEKQKNKEYPERSGNQLTPPLDPEHRELTGVQDTHEAGKEKRGRKPSYSSTRPRPVDSNFIDAGDVPVDNQRAPDDRGPAKRVKGREDIMKLGAAYTEKYKPVSFY